MDQRNQTPSDVIVIGGGTMGTAAAWQLSQRGVKVSVFEQYHHVHDVGSHGGQTRIFRHAYSEGADYVPLMLRADELWCEVEAQVGVPIVHRVGILEMDGPNGTHAKTARNAGEIHGIDYEWLTAAEIRKRWPAFDPPDGWEGGFSDRAGFLEVEPGLKGMRLLAEREGAIFSTQDPVMAWRADGGGAVVETLSGTYRTEKLIIAGGAWNRQLLDPLPLPLAVVRKTLFWIDVEDLMLFQPERFPVFAASDGETEIYGFPLFGQPGLKIADHLGGVRTSPFTVDLEVHPHEADPVIAGARQVLPALKDRVVSSTVCLYTRSPDEHFMIGRHPEHEQVVIAAGFSGHGFKFAPAIGEHLAQMALDDALPYPMFALERFASGADFRN